MATNEPQHEESTATEHKESATEFDLVQDRQGRLFFQIFTGKMGIHILFEIEEEELDALRKRLDEEPSEMAVTK